MEEVGAKKSKIILDTRTKELLIRQQIDEGMSSREIAKHHSISSRAIRGFKLKYVKRIKIHCKDGRPRSIDDRSADAIIEWMGSNRNYDKSQLKAIIKAQTEQTFLRKHPEFINRDGRRKNYAIPETVGRWYTYFTTYNGILF